MASNVFDLLIKVIETVSHLAPINGIGSDKARKYKSLKDYVDFLEYLIDNDKNNFCLLPQVCMRLHKSKEYNKLRVKQLTLNCTYDFHNIVRENVQSASEIEFCDTMEYQMEIENNDSIPETYTLYRGNTYSDGTSPEIWERLGNREYGEIPLDEREKYVNKYKWPLPQSDIPRSGSFPLAFKFVYHEKNHADAKDVIIFYPIQFAEKIEKVRFNISIKHPTEVMEKADLYQIKRLAGGFDRMPLRKCKSEKNHVVFEIEPKCDICEAYYIEVHWKLSLCGQ